MTADANAPIAPQPPHASAIAAYLEDIAAEHGEPGGPLVSLILFGSASTGGYAPGSDMDLLLVVRDGADAEVRERLCLGVARLEVRHGLAKPRALPRHPAVDAISAFADRITADVRSFFVCSRADLLSGDPARILGIPPAQAVFVDRAAIPSIVGSGVTVWGEDLLDAVPLPHIRRVDVGKAWFGLFGQAVFTAASYPLLPDATKYAMDTLKRSVHNCYFCHHARPAPLAEEIAFLEACDGPDPTLRHLLELRREYRPSYGFVLRCLPTLARLHLRTARRVRFPRAPRAQLSAAPGETPGGRSDCRRGT